MISPVFCCINVEYFSFKLLQYAAVLLSCHTIALQTGLPVFRSQTIVVSRWFVIPIAAIFSGVIAAFTTASVATEICDDQISKGSCSTQPGCGKNWVNSF